MRILIVKPGMYKAPVRDALQPLFAAALAAQTPPHVEMQLYDDRIETIPYDQKADLVAISIETFNARRSYEIASEFRKRGVKVIAGGYHPTLLPDETLEHTDSVLIGDAEDGWKEVLRDLQNGILKKRYHNPYKTKTAIRFDRSIFKHKHYGPVQLAQWGRGCPFHCDFCCIKAFYGENQFCRPIEAMVEELRGLAGKTVFFVDDNLYRNRKLFKAFLIAITPLNLKWACQISIQIARDDELLRLMKESGCFLVLIGIESFNKKNLQQMNKSWNYSAMSIEMAMKKITDAGLLIYGTFIFGYDHDTKNSFRDVIDFAVKNKFFIANFNPLYPMPGTPLYERLKKEERLLYDKWWLDPDFYYGKSMFYPRSMKPEELENYCYEAKLEFNSWKSIIQRGLNPNVTMNIKNLILFFYTNNINRREIISKQGRKLGI